MLLFCAFSIGCVVLYTGQGKFYSSTTSTLDYVVYQAESTGQKLSEVSGYFAAAKGTGVQQVYLPSDVQADIDNIESKISSASTLLNTKTAENSRDIRRLLNSV